MSKLNVGVVFGGRSVEHDVSVLTGLQIIHNLDKEKFNPIPIYITKSGKWVSSDRLLNINMYELDIDNYFDSAAIVPDRLIGGLVSPIESHFLGKNSKISLDVVIPAVHGVNGEDGTLQGLLELAEIPYVGSGIEASVIGMNKHLTKNILELNNIPVIKYIYLKQEEIKKNDIEKLIFESGLAYPLFVKPVRLGSSIGISKASNLEELTSAIEVALSYDNSLLIEPEAKGCIEVNCSVIRGTKESLVSICEQPVSVEQYLTFEDKYMRGENELGMSGAKRIIPAPISEELTLAVQDFAKLAYDSIGGMGLTRVDFFVNPSTGEVFLNEFNTIPGSFSFYLWEPTGISPSDVLDRLISIAFDVRDQKSKIIRTFDSGLLDKVSKEGVKFSGKF